MLAASEMQSGVFCLLLVDIVYLHTLRLDFTVDIFVLFRCRQRVVWILLSVHLKATHSIVFPWLSDLIRQWSAGGGV
jgi:hypothetical protein